MGKLTNFCPLNHFKAVTYKRLIIMKRSLKSIITSIVGTLIFSALGIAVQWMMIAIMERKPEYILFSTYNSEIKDIPVAGDRNDARVSRIMGMMSDIFTKDLGYEPNIVYFNTRQEMNDVFLNGEINFNLTLTAPFAVDFTNSSNSIILIYNSTTSIYIQEPTELHLFSHVSLARTLWKLDYGASDQIDIHYSSTLLNKKAAMRYFGAIGPMLLVCGLITIVPLLIAPPVTDIRGEVRQYMVQCTLKIFPYWLSSMVIDFVIWMGITTVVWALFNAGFVESFHDNLFTSWYLMVFQGPSFLLFLYCFSFLFSNPNAAPRQIFLLLALLLFIAAIVMMIYTTIPVWLTWVFGLFPHVCLEMALGGVLVNMGNQRRSMSEYWHETSYQGYFIMQWVDIVLYGIILFIIEENRLKIQRKAAKRSFAGYMEFFKKQKKKNPKSEETAAMEKEVKDSHDFAVRIQNVSRLFINAAGEPIPAVNDVSLGVKEGSLFGFLGANGAGKTTLIRMITGALPPSEGTIEIFGTKIEDITDSTILSICPQFNTHLCMELTPREHFKLYSMLFQLTDDKSQKLISKLMKEIELDEFSDQPIRELSGGDVRKLAIALSFFGPAKLILLDEPTAFLDPVACHCAQEMILEHKGEKTFMLCTHILSEAEMLCDMISIMVRGNVYTVGSPSYLTQKFGKEFKIDIMMVDDTEETARSVDCFFSRELPQAVCNIKRPVSRIYSVPASSINLPDLFEVMQKGEDDPTNGIVYFTCSSSSLERVFMEIVHISEMALDPHDSDEDTEKYEDKDSKSHEIVHSHTRKESPYEENYQYSTDDEKPSV